MNRPERTTRHYSNTSVGSHLVMRRGANLGKSPCWQFVRFNIVINSDQWVKLDTNTSVQISEALLERVSHSRCAVDLPTHLGTKCMQGSSSSHIQSNGGRF
jgi:hypothetical protein